MHPDFYETVIDRASRDFIMACEQGDLRAVKAIMEDSEPFLPGELLSPQRFDVPLYMAAYENRHWDIIRYLLTSPVVPFTLSMHRNHHGINPMLNAACEQGNLEMVQYLLSSPELGEHAECDITAAHAACRSGSIPLVKYLIKTYHTPENPLLDDRCFQAVVINNHISLLEYLLFDTPACQYLNVVRYLTTHDDVAFPRDLFLEDDFMVRDATKGIHYTPAAHYLFTSPKLTRPIVFIAIAPFQCWLEDNRMNDDMMAILNALPEAVIPHYAQKIRLSLTLSIHNTAYIMPETFVPYMNA